MSLPLNVNIQIASNICEIYQISKVKLKFQNEFRKQVKSLRRQSYLFLKNHNKSCCCLSSVWGGKGKSFKQGRDMELQKEEKERNKETERKEKENENSVLQAEDTP